MSSQHRPRLRFRSPFAAIKVTPVTATFFPKDATAGLRERNGGEKEEKQLRNEQHLSARFFCGPAGCIIHTIIVCCFTLLVITQLIGA